MQPLTKAENNGYDKHEKKEEKQKEQNATAHTLNEVGSSSLSWN